MRAGSSIKSVKTVPYDIPHPWGNTTLEGDGTVTFFDTAKGEWLYRKREWEVTQAQLRSLLPWERANVEAYFEYHNAHRVLGSLEVDTQKTLNDGDQDDSGEVLVTGVTVEDGGRELEGTLWHALEEDDTVEDGYRWALVRITGELLEVVQSLSPKLQAEVVVSLEWAAAKLARKFLPGDPEWQEVLDWEKDRG